MNSRRYPDFVDPTDPQFGWKDAFMSLGIAAVTAASLAVGAAYYFNMQLGGIVATGFRLFDLG